MANRWRNSGNNDRLYIFLGYKITADGDCSHEIKRRLLLRRKVMTNLDSILKSRDITLPTKVCLVKAMAFPVVMSGCELDYKESWASKNWCFWTVMLEKSLMFTGKTGVEAETPILCHLILGAESLERTLMLGKIEGRRRRGRQRMRWLGGITDLMDMSWVSSRSWWWTGKPGVLQSMGHNELDMTEWLNWTNWIYGSSLNCGPMKSWVYIKVVQNTYNLKGLDCQIPIFLWNLYQNWSAQELCYDLIPS